MIAILDNYLAALLTLIKIVQQYGLYSDYAIF